MPSKQVIDRLKRSLLVIASSREHRSRVGAAWADAMKPLLQPGEQLPDMELAMELLARRMERDMVAMQEAAERHEHELGDDAEPRDRRDGAATGLNGSINDLREIVRGLFGTPVLTTLRMEVAPPRDPATLSAYASLVITALEGAQLPAPRIPQAKFTPKTWARRLQKERNDLEAALKDVAREQREAEGTLADKNAAIAKHDQTQARVAGLTTGMLDFAGEAELADKVRPAARKGRGGSNEGEVGKDGTGEEPATENP